MFFRFFFSLSLVPSKGEPEACRVRGGESAKTRKTLVVSSSVIGHARPSALRKQWRRNSARSIYTCIQLLFFLFACRAETREVAQSLNRLPRLVTITGYIDTAHNALCAPSPPVYFLRLSLPTSWKTRDHDLERAYDEFLVSLRFSHVPRGFILRQISRNFHAVTFVIVAMRYKERKAGGGKERKRKLAKRPKEHIGANPSKR